MILALVRGLVFGVFVFCAIVAIGNWALLTRRINPFGRFGQLIRRATDPVLRPIERAVRNRGGNPRNAGWWLFGASLVGGILAITTTEWLLVQSSRMANAGQAGPRGILILVIYYAGQVVKIALIVRVIGSWFGVGRHTNWMRPAYLLTDWIVEPLRRIVPRLGMIDITPLVAWLLVKLLVDFLILPLV